MGTGLSADRLSNPAWVYQPESGTDGTVVLERGRLVRGSVGESPGKSEPRLSRRRYIGLPGRTGGPAGSRPFDETEILAGRSPGLWLYSNPEKLRPVRMGASRGQKSRP